MKKDYSLIIYLCFGLIVALVSLLSLIEKSVLLIEWKFLLDAFLPQVRSTVGEFIAQILVWLLIVIAVGFLWSNIFFRRRPLIERAIFTPLLGIFLIGFFLFVGLIPVFGARVLGTIFQFNPPQLTEMYLGIIFQDIAADYEQIWELVSALFFLILGLIIFAIQRLKIKRLQSGTP